MTRSAHLDADEIEFLRWRADRWMKVRHMPAAIRLYPRFVITNARRMMAHTFRGTTWRSLVGLESSRHGVSTRPGGAPSEQVLATALDPERRPSAAAVTGTGGDRLYRALGLPTPADDVLRPVPGAAAREQDVASHLANVLWESTLGAT